MFAWSFAVLAVLAQAVQSSPAPADPIVRGRQLYTTDFCYACHGTQGQGGKDGVRIAPNPLPTAAFNAYVRKPSGLMPAYAPTVLTDEELSAIYAYLKSIPAGRPAKAIPQLNR